MKSVILIIGFLGLISFCGICSQQKYYSIKYNPEEAQSSVAKNQTILHTDDSVYFKPQYFKILYKYIIKNGEVEKINASSRLDKPLYVEYHVLSFDLWELKVDNSERIYFTMSQPEYKQYGSILLTNDSIVTIESKGSADTQKICEGYNQILKKIKLGKKQNSKQ
ncbi:MAG: hypothetical protein PHE33_02890 [Bacteroidales bacterium]|nr:hypothetical protein [Bacteroidales bacterium]